MGVLKNGKHEKFCQSIANGNNQSQAYRDAGYSCNDDTVRRMATRLRTKDHIAERISELQNKTDIKNDIERSKIIERLEKLIDSCIDPDTTEFTDRLSYLKALDMLNKMSGQYSEKKILEGGDRPIDHKIEIEFVD